MIIKVKICGLTNLEDAQAAVDMGVDLVGFNFYKGSPRYIEPEKAAQIISRLPSFIDTVGIYVNAPLDEVKPMVEDGMLNWVQLHGDETPEYCDLLLSLAVRTIKAIRVSGLAALELGDKYSTDALLYDAYHPEQYGGTGTSFDWGLMSDSGRRVFLAGGITPDNALKAIELGVYGIDVCSGIESSPGKKDHEKMRRLFEAVQYARQQ